MAKTSNLDTTGWEVGLAKLDGPLRISLARSMAVAGGKVLRDEAKRQAPKDSGLLASAIYLAFKDAKSSDSSVTYSVTWNAKRAPHGHLVEFGHWQPYKVVRRSDGSFFSDVTQPLASPKWVHAKPFLRPAMDSAGRQAQAAMIERGRVRLPELLAGASGVEVGE